MRKISLILLVSIVLFSLTGEKLSFANTGADSGKTLRVGIPYKSNLFVNIKRYQTLFNYLENTGKIRFSLIWYDSYKKMMDEFNKRMVDMIFVDHLIYKKLKRNSFIQIGVEKVKGSFKTRAVILVRGESGINSVNGLDGKRIAITENDDIFSFIWFKDIKARTKKVYFTETRNPTTSIYKLFFKEADAATVDERVFYDALETNIKLKNQIKILCYSEEIPNKVVVVNSGIGAMTVRILKNLMQNIEKTIEGDAVIAGTKIEGYFFQPESFFK